jgi:hypothetical protein
MTQSSSPSYPPPSGDLDLERIRMQPQSVEAERSVIGGLLISPEG